MLRSRKYDREGTPHPGLFEIVCDGCGEKLESFKMGRELCWLCSSKKAVNVMNKKILGYFDLYGDCLDFLFKLHECLGKKVYTFDYTPLEDRKGKWVWGIFKREG